MVKTKTLIEIGKAELAEMFSIVFGKDLHVNNIRFEQGKVIIDHKEIPFTLGWHRDDRKKLIRAIAEREGFKMLESEAITGD